MLNHFSLEDICDTMMCVPNPTLLIEVEDGLFTLNAINQSARDQYQISDDEIGNSVVQSNFPDAVKKRIISNYQRVVDSGESLDTETDFKLPSGNQVWMSNRMFPLKQGDEVKYIIVSSTNVTELVEARKELINSLTHLASGFVTLCSWCKQVKHGDTWIPHDKFHYPTNPDKVCDQCDANQN